MTFKKERNIHIYIYIYIRNVNYAVFEKSNKVLIFQLGNVPNDVRETYEAFFHSFFFTLGLAATYNKARVDDIRELREANNNRYLKYV